jgi:hypothetical protein
VGERVWSAGTGFAGLFAAGQGVAYLTGNELPKAITQPASYVTTTLDLFNRDWNGLILDAVSWASDNFYEGDGTMIAPINSLGPNLNLIVPPPPVLLPNFGSQQNTKCP